MKNMIYAATSNEYSQKVEFSNKKAAIAWARWQRKCGWTAQVRDMRTGVVIY